MEKAFDIFSKKLKTKKFQQIWKSLARGPSEASQHDSEVLPEKVTKVLAKAISVQRGEAQETMLHLIVLGAVASFAFALISEISPAIPSSVAAVLSAAKLTQISQHTEVHKQEALKAQVPILQVILITNLVALMPIFGPWSESLLRCLGTLQMVIAVMKVSQIVLEASKEDQTRKIVSDVAPSLIETQKTSTRCLQFQLLDQLVAETSDRTLGCAMVRLVTSSSPQSVCMIETDAHSHKFLQLIQDCKRKKEATISQAKPSLHQQLSSIICSLQHPEDQTGAQEQPQPSAHRLKRTLREHLIIFDKSRNQNDKSDALKLFAKTSNHGTHHSTSRNIILEVKRMQEAGQFMLKVQKDSLTETMPDLRSIRPLTLNTEVLRNTGNRVHSDGQNFSNRNLRCHSSGTPSIPDSIQSSNRSEERQQSHSLEEVINNPLPLQATAAAGLLVAPVTEQYERAAVREELRPLTGYQQPVIEEEKKQADASDHNTALAQASLDDSRVEQSMPHFLSQTFETQSRHCGVVLSEAVRPNHSFVTTSNFQTPPIRHRSLAELAPRERRSNTSEQQQTNQVNLAVAQQESSVVDENRVFVYQIIHDLRHPLDAQQAKIEDLKRKMHKKLKSLKSLVASGRSLFKNDQARERLLAFDSILQCYCESKNVQELSAEERFEQLQKLIFANQFEQQSEMLKGISAPLMKPPLKRRAPNVSSSDNDSSLLLSRYDDNGDDFPQSHQNVLLPDGFAVNANEIEGDRLEEEVKDEGAPKLDLMEVGPKTVPIWRQQRMQEELKSALMAKQRKRFGGQGVIMEESKEGGSVDGQSQLLSSQKMKRSLDQQSKNSIPDKEILEPAALQKPAEDQAAANKSSAPDKDDVIKEESAQLEWSRHEEEEGNVAEPGLLDEVEGKNELLSDSFSSDSAKVSDYAEESTINDFHMPVERQSRPDTFKRKFGGDRGVEQFCQENDIEVLKTPIKTNQSFGRSLAEERLFIESKIAQEANFDFLKQKFSTVKVQKPDEEMKGNEPVRPIRSESARIHADINSARDNILKVLSSHSKGPQQQQQQVPSEDEDLKSRRSASVQVSQSYQSRSQKSKSNGSKSIEERRSRSNDAGSSNNSYLPGMINDPQMLDLLMLKLTEQKLQSQTIEKTVKFFMQIREEFDQIQAQQTMSMILMRDLLDHAQLKAGSFSIRNEYFDLEKVIQNAYNTNQKFASDRKVRLVKVSYSDPRFSSFFSRIYGDPRRYLQVLVNFVNNAIKFTPKNGTVETILRLIGVEQMPTRLKVVREESKGQSSSEEADGGAPDKEVGPDFISTSQARNTRPDSRPDEELKISTEQAGGNEEQESSHNDDLITVKISFQLIVRDSGVGISEENQKKLFRSFSRLDDKQQMNKSGVGLGLTIAKDLIGAFGGTIDVKKRKNAPGSDFTINLTSKCRITTEEHLSYFGTSVFTFLSGIQRSSHSSYASDSPNQQSQKHQSTLLSPPQQQNQYQSALLQPIQKLSKDMSNGSGSSSSLAQSLISSKSARIYGSDQNKGNDREEEKEAAAVVKPSTFSHRRVLAANDSTFLLSLLEDLLVKEFDEVVTVMDGQQAVEKVLEKPIDHFAIIILDINMPRKDGVEACIEIRNHFEQVKKAKEIEFQRKFPLSNTLSMDAIAMRQKPSSHSIKYDGSNNSNNGPLLQKEIQNHQIMRVSTVVLDKVPFIYALTSDIDSEKICDYLECGFDAVYKDITSEVVAQMIKQSNMRQRKGTTSSVQESSWQAEMSIFNENNDDE